METVTVDAGPLVTYLPADDADHAWVAGRFREFREPLLTCDAVSSEAFFPREGVVVEHGAQAFQDVARFCGKVEGDADDLSSAVNQAVGRERIRGRWSVQAHGGPSIGSSDSDSTSENLSVHPRLT